MPDLGLAFFILAFAAFGAGAIRGFSGFGDALFFLPLAGLVLDPIPSIAVFTLVASIGPLPLMPAAWREGPQDLLRPFLLTIAISTPIGFYFLTQTSPENFRYALSFIAIGLVILMALKVHPNFIITPKSVIVLGIAFGVLGGFTGVPGVLLIFVLLNSQLRAFQVRAMSLLSLLLFDVILLLASIILGELTFSLFIQAMLILPLYFAGSWLGRRIFDPEKEGFFRAVALFFIFMSGLLGLPFWSAI